MLEDVSHDEMPEYTTIRIYAEDFIALSQLLLMKQAEEKRRITWAEFIHLIVDKLVKGEPFVSNIQRG